MHSFQFSAYRTACATSVVLTFSAFLPVFLLDMVWNSDPAFFLLGSWIPATLLSRIFPGKGNEAEVLPEVYHRDLNKTIQVKDQEETLLDLSIKHRIPHMQECGGSGRCTTCRVRILDGLNCVTPPTAAETRLAQYRDWDPSVRLACQTKPLGRVTVERMIRTSSEVSRLQLEKISAGVAEERDLAILFCDMRNFTPFAEEYLPFDVVHVLNRFFGTIGEPILMNNGVIYQYVGDEITGLFGLDGQDTAHACRSALRAALGMVEAVKALNATVMEEFGVAIDIGIGLHYGPAVVGRIGHPSHRQFGVIGDAVNVASRLQVRNRNMETTLLVSETLVQHLQKDELTIGKTDISRLKGKSQPLAIYEVLGFAAPDDLLLVQSTLGTVLSEETAFSRLFYKNLFERHPEIARLFNTGRMDVQEQLLGHMLKHAIYAASRPDDFVLGVRRLGQRHMGYGVRPEHYQIVEKVLMDTLAQALDTGWTGEVEAAWQRTVQMVFRLMQEA